MWSVSAARSALLDAGWPSWDVDSDRVGVILGSALGGDKYVRTTLRIAYPEFDRELTLSPSFAALPAEVQAAIRSEARERFVSGLPTITEDTMPGELANIMAGRVAALFNLRGPNFTTDAACASALAGMSAAIAGLQAHHYDAAIAGGIDHNMGPGAFVRFCKIGALSATGTRPFDAGADGFVMGEGAALFVLKRLSDAERAGDHVYAVILGIGGSSDGKGKGITAPNPIGQKLAVARAWENAGADPVSIGMLEAHGTSTRVGDATELGALDEIFAAHGAAPGSIALGSVKSNIGHLKAAAGAAGLFKTIMSLNDKVLPPSLHFNDPNPNVDWAATPFRVNTELREWTHSGSDPRRAGVSAFGFGGTNFHVALEEYVPGRHRAPDAARVFAGADIPGSTTAPTAATAPAAPAAAPVVAAPAARKAPLRGAAVVGGRDEADVVAQLTALAAEAAAGRTPAPGAPDPALADAAIRVAIDYADAADLAKKADKAIGAFGANNPAMWKLLRSQGVFVGRGPAPKVAFLFTGQGSQYVNMLAELRAHEPIVRDIYDEADRIMTPLLGKPLSEYVFADAADPEAVSRLNAQLLQTEITQPAVLTTDAAMAQLLAAYGITPDLVMGHSLGEYGALVAAGALSFDAALEAVSARGREMTHVSQADNGAMAAVFGPLADIERIVAEVEGYVVVANINSNTQAVIGGATTAVESAVAAFQAAGMTAMRIPVSHAFHTQIVAGASEPLKVAMRRLEVRGPQLPIVANVTGEFYPERASTEDMLEILGRQIAEPVQFVKGLHTLYEAGARVFVEVGPKKALHGFVEEVLGSQHDDVLALFTNHPKFGDIASFNQALCGLYASGLGLAPVASPAAAPATAPTPPAAPAAAAPVAAPAAPAASVTTSAPTPRIPMSTARYEELGRLFAGVLEQGLRVYSGEPGVVGAPASTGGPTQVSTAPVAITGAALGLPGVDRVFDDENLARILDGQQFIDVIPHRFREAIVDKRITRLVKKAGQDPVFELIDDEAGVIKLAGRGAPLDVVAEFGVDAARDAALDRTTRLALGAGLDALRDAGIPLVMHYRSTTLGTMLPEKWGLPESMRDDTGVIFASAFPGYGEFAADIEKYMTDRGRREQVLALEAVRARMTGTEPAAAEVDRRLAELRHLLEVERFEYDRRFIFRCLAMGHSQFAEMIGARGPNTQINAACASTTQAVSLAEDWIRTGRCRRVVVVSADDVTSDVLLPWVGSGFLASGAAATGDVVSEVATPFDRRRHGMVVGMGAAAFVVESAEAVRERGLQPICEVLAIGHRQQRLPRNPPGRRPRRPGHGEPRAHRRGPRDQPHADRPADGVRVPRDLHPGPGRLGRRGGQRAAPRVRCRRELHRDHQHQGLHGPRHGRRHRGRRGDQGPGDRHRPAGAQLQGARPGARHPEPVPRRRLPGELRAAPGRRLRLPDRHDAAALDPHARRSSSCPQRVGPCLPDRGPGRVGALAGRRCRPGRRHPRGGPSPTAHRRHRRPVRRSGRPGCARRPRGSGCPCRGVRCCPANCPGRGTRSGTRRRPRPGGGPGSRARRSPQRPGRGPAGRRRRRDRLGDDRLPGRAPRRRPGPRGRPRRGHRQAGRGLRRRPRQVRHRARRQRGAARLPDPDPRHRLGPRQDRHPTRHGCPCRCAGYPCRGTRCGTGRRRCTGCRRGHRRRHRDRLGDDRVPGRAPRRRPGPRGRPRRRHRQAGRGLRRRPGSLRHRARRQRGAARLPDPDPRHRLGPRQDRHPADRRRTRGVRCRCPGAPAAGTRRHSTQPPLPPQPTRSPTPS